MKIIVTNSYEDSCKEVANIIVNQVKQNPETKLGLATGGTAEKVYPVIVEAYKDGKVDFSKVSSVNLDEYVGMDPANPVSYRRNMDDWFFNHINIDKANTYVASGLNDMDEEVKLFNEKIYGDKQVDLQLLGVGVSGHIGFNEPGDKLTAGVHVEKLTESTIEANSRYFDSPSDVPKTAITMGIGDIMKAKSIVLIATGDHKANALSELLLNDEVKTDVPVTLLKLHYDTTIVIDKALADKVGYKA